MPQVTEFLDLYKQLEDALEEKYVGAKRKYSSVVMEFYKSPKSESVRSDLDICREIRNLLTHNPNIGGMPVVKPSEPIIEKLKDIIEFVKKPPLAMDYAVKGSGIMTASLTQKVLRLMSVMDKNGYSHTPVMKNGVFHGVFSAGTIFQYILYGGSEITEKTTVEDLSEHLPINAHKEKYAFVPRNTDFFEVREKFEKPIAKNQRISVVFITENGKENERLLGMIVPSDVLTD